MLDARRRRIAGDLNVAIVHPDDSNRRLAIRELNEHGAAEITVEIPVGRHGISLDLHGHTRFSELAKRQSADGSVLFEGDAGWVGVVVECKKTLLANRVVEAVEQLRCGLNRLAMMATLLELPVRTWHSFIATREWRDVSQAASDPVLRKHPIRAGRPLRYSKQNLDSGSAVVDDTAAGTVALGLIQLDDEGRGALLLPIPSSGEGVQKNESG